MDLGRGFERSRHVPWRSVRAGRIRKYAPMAAGPAHAYRFDENKGPAHPTSLCGVTLRVLADYWPPGIGDRCLVCANLAALRDWE